MKVIFVSSTCSGEQYKSLQIIKHSDKLNPSQKYFDMLIQGLVESGNTSVICISARTITRSNSDVKGLNAEHESISDKLEYFYIKTINRNIVRNICNLIEGYRYTLKLLEGRDDNTFLVCDPLSYDISIGAIIAAKKRRVKTCAIVTDLPNYMSMIQKRTGKAKISIILKNKLSNILINSFNKYCFLTESMNIINNKNKPYIVVEGMTYPNIPNTILDNHVEKNIVLYAGGLYEQFGIKTLLEASKLVMIPDFELHLYGEGNCVNYLKDTAKTFTNVKYMGTVGLEQIVDAEKKAKILINPRPSAELFTEYSFPSKIVEYMSAARPVLTTRLKGIPSEYYSYILPIDDESIQGIAKSIETLLLKNCRELDEIGRKTYQFVSNEKNGITQADKVKELLKYGN